MQRADRCHRDGSVNWSLAVGDVVETDRYDQRRRTVRSIMEASPVLVRHVQFMHAPTMQDVNHEGRPSLPRLSMWSLAGNMGAHWYAPSLDVL